MREKHEGNCLVCLRQLACAHQKKYTGFWDFRGSAEDKALKVMIELAAVTGHLSSFSQSVVIQSLFSSNRNLFFILTDEDHPSHLCRKAANGMYEAFVQHLSAATWARLCAQLKLCMLFQLTSGLSCCVCFQGHLVGVEGVLGGGGFRL